MTEQPLTGGRITPGVVRIGDTVRRPAGPHSPFLAALLQWLAERGFDGAPRHLGSDDQGRDVLSYLDGDVPARFRTWTDAQVRAAAGLVDAMLERLERNARWWSGRRDPKAPEVVAWTWREHAFVSTHRDRFTAALDGGDGGRR